MKRPNLSKLYIVGAVFLTLVSLFLFFTKIANAQSASLWYLSSSNLRPNVSTWGLQVPSISGSTQCLQANSSGVISGTGSGCGSGGGGSGNVATSSTEVQGNLSYWTTGGATPAKLGNVATSTISFSGPFIGASALGALVGGSNSTVTWTGLATTSQPSTSNLLYSTGAAGVAGVGTTTLSGSGVISVTAGAVVIGGSPISISCSTCGTGTVTSISLVGLDGTSPITTIGTISAQVGTSSVPTLGQLPYWTGVGTPSTLGSIATSTITITGPFVIPTTLGTLVGGSNTTITYTGLATTSQPASSNLLVSNGTTGVYGVATSTLSASAPITGSFTQVGTGGSIGCTNASSGVTGCLTGTDWTTFNGKQATISSTWPIILTGAALSFGWATTSQPASSNLFVSNGTNGFYGVATTSATCGSGVSCTGFNVLGSSNPSFALASMSAGVLGSVTSAAPTSQATSTLYGTAPGGQVLGWSNVANGIAWIATSSSGTGTVTSIVVGNGLNGGTITTSGQIDLKSYIATSSLETAGQLAVWTTSSANPAKLGTVATSTLTATGLLSISNSPNIIGASGAVITLPVAKGNFVVGNDAGTAQATSTIFITSLGKVGVASTTPHARLSAHSPGTAPTENTFELSYATGGSADNATTTIFTVASTTSAGNALNIGTSSPYGYVSINPNLTTDPEFVVGSSTGTNLIVKNSGLVGLGTTSPYATLSINTTSGTDAFAIGSSTGPAFKVDKNGAVFAPIAVGSGSNQTGYWCYDGNGQLIRDTTVCLVSALKFKKNINDLSSDFGLSAVLKMKPVTYYLKTPFGKEDAGQHIGFVADWSEAIVPQLVTHDSSGDVHGFDYQAYTAVLTKALQEQQKEIEQIGGRAGENWQWLAIITLIMWNIALTRKTWTTHK